MSYGNYALSPVPMVSLNREFNRSGDDTIIGITNRMVLDGWICPTGEAGLEVIDADNDSLQSAFSSHGSRFLITCVNDAGVTGTIMDVYPRVLSISIEPTNDNWTATSKYSIELESYVNAGKGIICSPRWIDINWVL